MAEKLTGKIESLQNSSAVIKLSNGQKIPWPLDNLPMECEIGTEVTLTISAEKNDDQNKDELAKQVLNDFLRK